jgi:two-component system, NtrC family, response regulator
MEALASYEWPGNVRELFNAIEKAFVAAHQSATLYPKHLPTHVRVHIARGSIRRDENLPGESFAAEGDRAGAADGASAGRPAALTIELPVEESAKTCPAFRDFCRVTQSDAEKRYLTDLLSVTRGDIRAACKVSGLSQSRLYELLKKHRLTRFLG